MEKSGFFIKSQKNIMVAMETIQNGDVRTISGNFKIQILKAHEKCFNIYQI